MFLFYVGEDVIQVAVEQESGNSQPVVYPQNTATVQQNGKIIKL